MSKDDTINRLVRLLQAEVEVTDELATQLAEAEVNAQLGLLTNGSLSKHVAQLEDRVAALTAEIFDRDAVEQDLRAQVRELQGRLPARPKSLHELYEKFEKRIQYRDEAVRQAGGVI